MRAVSTFRRCWPRTAYAIALTTMLLFLLDLSISVLAAAEDVHDTSADRAATTHGKDEASSVAAAETNPYTYLDRFDLAELKKYAVDKHGKRINVDQYTDKTILAKVVQRFELQENKHAALRRRVEQLVAVQRGAEGATADKEKDEESAHVQSRRRLGKASALSVKRRHNIVIEACTGSQNDEKARKMLTEDVYLAEDVTGLDTRFNINVIPSEPSASRRMLSNSLRASFFTVIGIALLGGQFLPPAVIDTVNRRRGLVVSTGMILNVLAGTVLQTGAFEVYVDGKLVFSKLKTGKLPLGWELSEIVLNNTVLAAV